METTDVNEPVFEARSLEEVQKYAIINAREAVLSSMQEARRRELRGGRGDYERVRVRLERLFLLVQAMWKRHHPKEDAPTLYDRVQLTSDDDLTYDHLLSVYIDIDTFLDGVGVTRVDTKEKLGGNLIERNKAQGWYG